MISASVEFYWNTFNNWHDFCTFYEKKKKKKKKKKEKEEKKKLSYLPTFYQLYSQAAKLEI